MNAFSWIPASVTKRLIRYALLKYDILETDALDLDNLDVAIGRSNSFEFRYVKLNQKKLTDLLKLPEHLHLESAHVALLRLTITFATVPVIVVDVEGPEIRARLEDPTPAKQTPNRATFRKAQRKTSTNPDNQEDIPTTAHDLAASFLAHEPVKEKEELQARALAQSADLYQSTISTSLSTTDEDVGVGVDSGLTGIVGGYVKAIVDRLQINIRDVSVNIKLDVPIPGAGPSQAASEPLVLILRTSRVTLLDARDHPQADSSTKLAAEASDRQSFEHLGKTVVLQDVQGLLSTNKDVLARIGPLPENSVPAKDPSSPVQSWPKTTSSSPSSHSPAQTFRSMSSLSQSQRFSESLAQSVDSIHGSFKDPNDPTADESDSILFREQSHQEVGSTYESSVGERPRTSRPTPDPLEDDEAMYSSSPFPGNIEDSLRLFRGEKSQPDGSIYYSRSSMPVSLRSGSRTPSPSRSKGAPPSVHGTRTPSPSVPFHSTLLSSSAISEPELPNVTVGASDNLAASTIYTHEDAQSIYMSVLDEGTAQDDSDALEASDRYHIPGGWGEPSEPDVAAQATRNPLPPPPPQVGTGSMKEDEVESETRKSELTQSALAPDHSFPPDQVVTTLFSIDETEVVVPYESSTHTHDSSSSSVDLRTADSIMLQSSTIGHASSTFSTYATHSARRRSSLAGARIKESEVKDQTMPSDAQSQHSAQHFRITVGNVTCKVNITTCRLLLQLARRLQTLFQTEDGPTPPDIKYKSASSGPPIKLDLSLVLRSLEVEVADTGDSPHRRGQTGDSTYDSAEKSVFVLRIDHTNVKLREALNSRLIELAVGTLLLDVAGERVISFSKDVPLTESTRDAKATKDDIYLRYETSTTSSTSALSLLTMPLRIDLDFHRIDDTLSSFGGFSGLIELGNSILSESEIVSTPPVYSDRPRAVRFDANAKPADDKTTGVAEMKMSCRIRGTDIMLRGSSTTIRYQSTPIKAIVRDGAVVVQIDVMKVTAPYTGPRCDPELEVSVSNMRFHYLVHPDERDLSRLISLLTPSNDKFEKDDDLLLDTLIRQRKKGAGARLGADDIEINLSSIQVLRSLQDFGIELTKLSVAKYLPEESRPGMLMLGSIKSVRLKASCVPRLKTLDVVLQSTEFAQVGAPSLLAVTVQSLKVSQADGDELLHKVVPSYSPIQPPMIMARLIGDELEPTLKVKLWNVALEYSALLAETLMGYEPGQEHPDVAADLTASIATLTERPPLPKASTFASDDSQDAQNPSKPLAIDVAVRDCALGLTPRSQSAKALLVLTQAHFATSASQHDDLSLRIQLQKANLYLTDDVKKLADPRNMDRGSSLTGSYPANHIMDIDSLGYVSVFWLQAMSVSVEFHKSKSEDPDTLDIAANDGLMVMETCADSQKTLTDVLGALSPAVPPAKGRKYQTEIAPLQDMIASFTGDAFMMKEDKFENVVIDDSQLSFDDAQDAGRMTDEQDLSTDFDNIGGLPGFIGQEIDSQVLEDSIMSDVSDPHNIPRPQTTVPALDSSQVSFKSEIITGELRPARMPPKIHGFAKKWDSTNNRYVHLNSAELSKSPIRVKVRNNHVIWNLHDGYDWEKTRDVISKAVYEVQNKAEERRSNRRTGLEEEDQQPIIEDFLFNSIYIGVDVANADPKDLREQINRNMDEMMTETGSHTSTTVTARPSSSSRPLRPHGKKLRLNRSKRHKITFELKEIDADIFMFQPGGETQSSIDVRIQDFEIFDHVPTSTWKKFATYMHDAGPREDKKPMLHLEVCDVRPVPALTASELVLRVTVLPVRLHVDQDALDFMTRFFEFKDEESTSPSAPPDQPYLQRVEVRPVPVKLDFKPKRIDYAGLRSGRTSEFKNIFVLDGAAFVLKHVIIYGVSGFLKLHHSLEDIWMPDVTRNQLPTVLSGLGGVRTLVNVGTGMRDLVMIPVQEYQKDGRIVRSISKGVSAFGRSTGGELTRFGAKLAVGAQTYLQGAEELLSGGSRSRDGEWAEADLDEEEKRAISHYADQPAGILQGLKGAAKSLERDLLVARDVIIAISGELSQAESAEGAARAIARNAPTLILRPMIGATKAIGQTLMGATNTVDPQNKKRIEDKYKHH